MESNIILDMLDNEHTFTHSTHSNKLSDVEKSVIIEQYIMNNFNKTHTARCLGISRELLYFKLNKHGIHMRDLII
jgi:DNA-binding NtrC family response regulator